MSLAEEADRAGLHRVGARPSLVPYLTDVWHRREFIVALAKFKIEAENGRNRLGMGWVVLKPLINAAVYGAIFGFLMGPSARPEYFVAFLIIGVFFFEYFSTCLTMGAKSITSNAALVQSLSFPRMALPISLVTQRLLMFVPTIPILVIVVLASRQWPTWEWLGLIPLLAIFTVFNAGLTLITARLTVHFRDLTQLLPFVARFIFYTSGIFFSVEKRFADHPVVLTIADAMPIHEFLSLARGLLLDGADYPIHQMYWLYGSLWAVVTLVIGIVFFWAAEERYGRTN